MYSISEEKATTLNLPKRTVKVFVGAEAYKSKQMTIGKTIVPPHTEMQPHTHYNEEEIVFVIKGEGYAIINGIKEVLKPDTAVVFPTGLEHVVVNDSDDTLEFVFMFNPVFNFNGLI